MAKIQIGGAGGAPANNVIRSLRESRRDDYLIGTSCVASDLFLADTDEKHLVPAATAPEYPEAILKLLNEKRPDFIHAQHDFEVRAVSRLRDKIQSVGVKLFLPSPRTIEACVNKLNTYEIWKAEGIRVPETLLLRDASDLQRAFSQLGSTIWVRATEGAGGNGSVPTDNYEFAKLWIDRYHGWGSFTASELLSDASVTWLSIWFEGELVVAQGRRRRSWNFGNRTLSGVTGITGVAETCSNPEVDRLAQDAILAVDPRPHGLFGVDMTYDRKGEPNLTEINIGRFFTTVYFFTKAGLNMPEVYCEIALENKFPVLERRVNPLPEGLVWIRGMDVDPVLTNVADLKRMEQSAP
jgi:carbamoyl-phosphate synthase large subunit